MITTVIFDLYGTLLQRKANLNPYEGMLRSARERDFRASVRMLMTGNFSSLKQFHETLGLPITLEMATWEKRLRKDLEAIVLFPETISVLRALAHQGYSLGLISNLSTPYKTPVYEFKLDELIPIRVYSCDCGHMKPDREIYHLALEQLSAKPEEAVMIGDSLRSDVRGPAQIGIHSLHLDRRQKASTADAISDLNGVLRYLETS